MRDGAVFLGREQELGELSAALSDAADGRGRFFLLVGEPGIGKTRLASEACDRAAAAGFAVLWGRCWESGGAPAYWPWTQILSELSRAADAAADFASETEALAAIAPDLAPHAAGRREPTPAGDADQARFRIFRALVSILGRTSARRPLALVLDDLHAADQSSLLLLQFVARELRGLRVVIIGGYRDVEARLSPEIEQLLGRIGRDARTLHLARLGSNDVASFIRSVAGEVPPATVASIFHATAGNPLFLDEVLRTMLARGDLRGPAEARDVVLPFGVRDAIRQHLARLSDSDRPMVEVASVLGNEVRPSLLAAASSLPVSDVQAALARAAELGILVERGHHRFGFGHGLIREALYRDLPNSRRMELHARVGQALDAEAVDPDRPWAELAHHLLEAGPTFVERAVFCAIRAAERALEAVAYDEALTILERAGAALDVAPRLDAARAELCLAESLVRARIGDTARGRVLCLRAATLARGLGDSDLFARVALGYGAEFAFALVDPQLVELLREALAALPPADSPLRARVMARLAAALQPADHPEQQVAAARDAIKMARRIGDKPTLLAVLHAGMGAMMDYANPDERLPLNTEAERLAAELGDRAKALRAHARLVCDHVERGDLSRADAHIDAHERLAGELKFGRAMWQAPLMRAMRAMMEGRFSEAQRLSDEALAVGQQVGDRRSVEWSLILHRYGFLRAREAHEELDRLRPELRLFWNELPHVTEWWHATEGSIHARLGRQQEAAESFRGVMAARLIEQTDSEGLAMLTEICVAAGDKAVAADLYARMAPRAHQLASWGMTGIFCEGPFHRHLGLLAALLGRREDAIRHFEAAAARNSALGLRPHLTRVLYEHARLMSEDTRDAAAAAALAKEARELATELQMTGLVQQIDALPINASRPATPATKADVVGAFEMRREGDFWTLVCDEGQLHLKDTRGMQTLHRLLTNPDQEFHVMDLAAVSEGVPDAGDAGELLDREARDSYRDRLEDLNEEKREAEQLGDAGRAARAQEEIEVLAGELARAVGLGGRDRKAGSAAERARVAVQKRIKDAIRKIQEGAPGLGRHLAMSVQTGTFCVYRPSGRLR